MITQLEANNTFVRARRWSYASGLVNAAICVWVLYPGNAQWWNVGVVLNGGLAAWDIGKIIAVHYCRHQDLLPWLTSR